MARRRPRPLRHLRDRSLALAAGLALATLLAVVVPPRPVAACSGAPAVLAPDLEAHVGRIVVARIVERTGRVPGPRGISLAVEESLRGAGPDLISVARPRQATNVCHDAFTVWRNTRLLVAFAVHPLDGGGPLMPAWVVRKDGTLKGIYDDPPWPTLADARLALERTATREAVTTADATGLPIAVTLLAGAGVLAAAVVVAGRERGAPARGRTIRGRVDPAGATPTR